MPSPIEAESTLTDRYQTTVPDPVRRALQLEKRDKIRYSIQPDGTVLLSRAEPHEAHDPILDKFLDFLANDMAAHPETIGALESDLVNRIQTLVQHVEFDLDAPLSADDE